MIIEVHNEIVIPTANEVRKYASMIVPKTILAEGYETIELPEKHGSIKLSLNKYGSMEVRK